MAIVTGDRYLDFLVKFIEKQAGPLLEGSIVLKLNPVGLQYVQTRLEQLQELEGLLAGAPVDYFRAYVSDLGDHRALEQLRRILRLLTSLKVVSVLPPPARDPTPLSLLPFGRLRMLELRGCDLSTSAARGLLELRHTLEKIICHNSTDALRHVFASRIVDIKDSSLWNKLSFVWCSSNGLVLMDESLQLLPVVETLDLSKNRFAKVDNLWKCTKLRHLDLGYNHLTTVASLCEVVCPIVKLVLRNNALTTLRGIENLKSLEGLDLSYNIISIFSELELLASLSSLQDLWLEGNPVCCARWYRAQVFSIFSHPEKLKLDGRGINTQESWKRQIILASRQRCPAGYGFYSPAKDASEEGSCNTKRRKFSRLASIEDDEQRSFYGSESVDQETLSCDSGNVRRDENPISDGEAEIMGLMNRVEFMKKERSILWLREFREWMDQTSEDIMDENKFTCSSFSKENYKKNERSQQHIGESSRYVSDSVQDSGDESSTNIVESDISFTDTSIGFQGREHFNSNGKATLEASLLHGIEETMPVLRIESVGLEEELPKVSSLKDAHLLPLAMGNSIRPNSLEVDGDNRTDPKDNTISLAATNEIMEIHSSFSYHRSPPHYQEDILHRRQNLEEEFLQLSAESYSLASSDSDTSCSDDDDSCKFCTSVTMSDSLLNRESENGGMDNGKDVLLFEESHFSGSHEDPHVREKTSSSPDSACANNIVIDPCVGIADENLCEDTVCLDTRRGKRKPRKRVVSLPDENFLACDVELLTKKLNSVLEFGEVAMDDRLSQRLFEENGLQKSPDIGMEDAKKSKGKNPPICAADSLLLETMSGCQIPETDEFIKTYFNENIADPRVSEMCLQFIRCGCMLHDGSISAEIEVAVLLSSERKLYILVIGVTHDGPGNITKVMGCHRLDDINAVVIGLGLQVLRVQMEKDVSYLFITRTIEISRELLCLLQVCDSIETSNECSLRRFRSNRLRTVSVGV